jgi:hypothetical protein
MHSLNTIIKQNKSKAIKLIDRTKLAGGVSFNCDLEVINITDGFTVSIKNIIITDSEEEIEKKLNSLNRYVLSLTGSFFGLWLHNSKFYLDVNINTMTKGYAIKTGQYHNQVCIFDEANKREVKI